LWGLRLVDQAFNNLRKVEQMVNTEETRAPAPVRLRNASAAMASVPAPAAATPVRRRLGAPERERQIVAGATEFFARRGLDAQMRELAAEIGIAHTLLYHYFPSKRLLIERVYAETIAGRWDERWEALLDDPQTPVADKLHAFYREYLPAILTPDWLRILVHSGLSDGLIPDRYFAMVRERLFPRLLREARRAAGSSSRAKATPREEALLLSFHGGLIYHLGIWPLIYQQSYTGQGDAALTDTFIGDRIRGLLAQMPDVMPAARSRRAA